MDMKLSEFIQFFIQFLSGVVVPLAVMIYRKVSQTLEDVKTVKAELQQLQKSFEKLPKLEKDINEAHIKVRLLKEKVSIQQREI